MLSNRAKFWARTKKQFLFWKKGTKTVASCGVHSIDQLRVLIEHERRRSDRTGDRFSVIVFPVEHSGEDLHRLCHLPDLLVQTVRSTDEVGWFDVNQIGVLLLDTPSAGAQKFLKKIRDRAPSSWTSPKNQIYVYPSEQLFGEHGGSTQPPILDVGEKMDSLRDSKAGRSKRPGGAEPIEPTEEPAEESEQEKESVVSSLEPYLGIKAPLWKRIFDILGCLTGLLLLSPFLVFIAVWIKTVSPGPVFFKQKRIGYLGKPFILLKFRTMYESAKSSAHEDYVRTLIQTNVPMEKLNQDKELIRFGKFMRSSGIDELPQLFNVVCGEMSLVGPRPCLPSEFQEYLHWHKRRFYTLPGITGLWQVNGKHKLTFKQMIRYDITYEQQRSFWLDFKIIIGTFPTVYRLTTDG